MENNSVEEFLDWLKVEPRMLGWGAVLAYGRSETNKVLLQEYVQRFASADYMAPITEEILDNQSPTNKDFLHNYQMDTPRLSFLGSTLQKSSARVTMKVVGGSHLKFTKPPGNSQWSLSSVAEEDALDGPTLKYKIDLLASSGSVTSAGEVILDISNGTEYELTGFDSAHLRRVAGARMQGVFRPLPDSVKKFKLNELKFAPGQSLKPASFEVRTHNKKGSGAGLLSNEDEGEGAVLLFVRMEGEKNGTLPVDNADLRYLLPEGYTATILLNRYTVMRKIIAPGFLKALGADGMTYELEEDGVFNGVIAGGGGFSKPNSPGIVQQLSRYMLKTDSVFIGFYDGGYDNKAVFFAPGYKFSNGGAVAESFGFYMAGVQRTGAALIENNMIVGSGSFDATHSTTRLLTFVVKDGGLAAEAQLIPPPVPDKVLITSGIFNPPVTQEDLNLVVPALDLAIREIFLLAYEKIADSIPSIDAFVFTSLLFRNKNAIEMQSAHFQLDMAIFGHVGSTLTTFTIDELEPVIGHSEVFKFTTTPPRNDLKWTVHNIIDETVPKGSIGELSGLYTAPVANDLEGNFVRVRVTASAGEYSSSALVTVMRRGITVNPMIRIATAGDPLALDVSAGTIGGRALQWSVAGETPGAVVRPNPEGGHSYVPGPKQAKTAPSIDTITVHDPVRKVSETAKVLVLHRTVLLNVVIDEQATLLPNQIQLAIMGEDGPVNPGDWGETWTVQLGELSAQINPETGVLTINPDGPDRYVVVTVLAPPARPGGASDDGYILLPIPMFGVPEAIQMLCADGQ